MLCPYLFQTHILGINSKSNRLNSSSATLLILNILTQAMNTKVCIIRHGETDWNREGRIQGQLDIPLNEAGRAQALTMATNAAHFNFSTLYSSDLARAMETARALAQCGNLEIQALPQLRERHFGNFQGVLKNEAPKLNPKAYELYKMRDLRYGFETGESLMAFAKRVINIFDWLIRHHTNQQIAVVCHAGVLDVMYRHATSQSLQSKRDFDIPNSALNWFHHDGNRWHLDHWDDHHHVRHVIMDSVE